MLTPNDFFENVDWILLKKQKAFLLKYQEYYRGMEIYYKGFSVITDLLDGLINMIDEMQDIAAEIYGVDTVFGDPEP